MLSVARTQRHHFITIERTSMHTSRSPLSLVGRARLRRARPDRRIGPDACAAPRRRPRPITRSPPTSASSANTSSAASRRPPASPRCRAASTGGTRAASISARGRRTSAGSRTSALYTALQLEWDFYGGYKGTFPATKTSSRRRHDLLLLPGHRNPGRRQAQHWEVYAALNWKWLSAKASYSLDDYFGVATHGKKTDGTWYFDFYANYPVGDTGSR